ncbi:MAG: hypothetical protein ACREFR_16990 [Limisphaerales bacterium]
MNSTHPPSRIVDFSLLGGAAAVLALVFGLANAALATDPIYQNFSDLYYTIPGTPPPPIDASNFDNENQFNVNFQQESLDPQFYEPENTVNYTNNSSGFNTGIMTADSPFTNIDGDNIIFNSTGAGFQFDTLTTNTLPHIEAGTFHNSGQIRCESVIDGNNVISFDGENFFFPIDIGQCLVWATNIICPGTIIVGENGLIQLTGDNVDLSHAVLTLEQGLVTSNYVDATINSEGEGFDFSTNGVMVPSQAFTATNADSLPPDNLNLAFPASYFNVVQEGPSNMLVRAVFLVNQSTNVPVSVYIASPAFNGQGALFQWYGTYLNPVTDTVNTNYLYLFHYYFQGTNLPNILTIGTIPNNGDEGDYANFLWAQGSPYPGLGPPTSEGYQNIFNDNVLSNVIYEYFNASLTGTTVGTNASAGNPGGALTNMPSRVQITANRDLKMNLAQIQGLNYLSLTATNQFDGSPGALISSPYSDINLAVTNGYPHPLSISNLLASDPIPQWGGTLDEWSTRWTNTDINGVSWDYRVALVYSSLVPSLTPQVQNLTLSASNVDISDILNIFGATRCNARSLTLTTNYFGGTGTSPDGELDMQNADPYSWSWSVSFPNLLWLDNAGAIRLPNFSDFVSSASVTNITQPVPAVQAAATLAESNSLNNIAAGGAVTILDTSYQFVKTLNNRIPYQVKVGPNFNGSMSNLIAAINRGPGSGTSYSSDTFASSVVVAGLLNVTNRSVVISASANYVGTVGNGIPVSTTVTNLAWSSAALAGGVDSIAATTNIAPASCPYSAIINNGYLSDLGSTIWVTNFLNGGVISNGPGSFLLNSINTTLTNGSITAGGDISFTANTLIASNIALQAGRSLDLQVTNYLWDGGASNANVWAVGATNGTGANGLMLPFLPTNTTPPLNNLLGTSISLVTPAPNKQVASIWAGLDYGTNTIGYNTNNVAIGQLILNSQAPESSFYFSGPPDSTTNNAIYVDQLVLENFASLADREGSAGIPTLQFNNNPGAGNLTIYYADAVSSATVNGGPLEEVSYLLDGLNGGHLVWIPQYVGIYSSTTNHLNIGLVENSQPGAIASRVDFKLAAINVPQKSVRLTWESFPGATNAVYYSTNLVRSDWLLLTNFVSPTNLPPMGVWPISDAVLEPYNLSAPDSYYRVIVTPNSSFP